MNKFKNSLIGNISVNRIMFLLAISFLVMVFPSCNKDKNLTHLSVQMTDAPGNFGAVYIDLQGVEIKGNGGSLILLNANEGIYNLLDFSNGADTLIASGDLEAGEVSQMRLILGSDNTVMVDGVIYPLSTPSAMQSGLKLQMHHTFEAGVSYSILLDFDANQSIVREGNGTYSLKPVIRTIEAALNGSIKGSITPVGIIATVSVTSNGITYSSVTNDKGLFLVSGLPAGLFDVTVTPPLPLLPVSLTGKAVVIGTSTNLGVIAL